MSERIDKNALYQEWIHSREEDTEQESIFRPADYEFPLTRRPRESFQLASDGSLTKGGVSPADRREEERGTWELKNDEIAFYADSKPVQKRVISSVEPSKLVLKK